MASASWRLDVDELDLKCAQALSTRAEDLASDLLPFGSASPSHVPQSLPVPPVQNVGRRSNPRTRANNQVPPRERERERRNLLLLLPPLLLACLSPPDPSRVVLLFLFPACPRFRFCFDLSFFFTDESRYYSFFPNQTKHSTISSSTRCRSW